MGCCVARYIFVNKTALDVFDKIGAASRSFVHHLSVSEYDSESSFSKHHCSCLNLPTASNISDITNIGLVLYRFTSNIFRGMLCIMNDWIVSFPCHHKIKGAAKATVQTTTATVQTTTAPVQNYYGHSIKVLYESSKITDWPLLIPFRSRLRFETEIRVKLIV